MSSGSVSAIPPLSSRKPRKFVRASSGFWTGSTPGSRNQEKSGKQSRACAIGLICAKARSRRTPRDVFRPLRRNRQRLLFGLYIDGELASSVRIHVGSKEHPDFPSFHVFPEALQPQLDTGKVIIDTTRFVADEKLSRLHRGLPYATLRLASWPPNISPPTICSRPCERSIRRFTGACSIIS